MSVEFHCPSCGKKQFSYEPRERRYEKVIKSCKSCGKEYLDPRSHELAAEGIPADAFSVTPYLLMLVVGGLIGWRGWYLFGRHQLGTPSEISWLLPSVFLIMGVVCVIASIVGIIRIKTGSKQKQFERLMQESRMRLKDTDYAGKLQALGYALPREYTIGQEDSGNEG
ncbi:MAG: hypothetical protein K6E18_02835 [Lachnospiraceae bacterium]|nr:hypothetical protein [Lachnospiraceae bacterium]